MWICIAPCGEPTSKALRYGMRSQEISQFYLHTPRTSVNGMNHTCLCLPSRSWYSFTDPGGMKGWVGLGLLGPVRSLPSDITDDVSEYSMSKTEIFRFSQLFVKIDSYENCMHNYYVNSNTQFFVQFMQVCGLYCK